VKKDKPTENSRYFRFKLYELFYAIKDHITSNSENQEIYVNAKDGTFNEDRIFLYVSLFNDFAQ
jgi:hypothetical protein